MHLVAALLLIALFLPACPAAAQQISTQFEATSHPEQADDSDQAFDLGFKNDESSRMTVPVRLSGTGPYDFLVDTGSDRTTISRDLAHKLRLTPGEDTRLHSVTGSSNVSTAVIPLLEIRAKQVRDIDAPLLQSEHMGADGILGLDSVQSQRILFDFTARTLTIVPSSEPSVIIDKDTIVVSARRKNGRLVLTQAKANNKRLTVVVDTGSEISIGNQALKRHLLRRGLVVRSGPAELLSVTGERLMGEFAVIDALEIGGVRLEGLVVVIADSHAFHHLGLVRRPAMLLGMNALRGFDKVSIDFARKKLRLVLPQISAVDSAVMAAR